MPLFRTVSPYDRETYPGQPVEQREAPTEFHIRYERDRVPQCPLPTGGPGEGPFPQEQAALKCLYLATRALDPTGKGRARWVARWKPALNAFAITFEGRITPIKKLNRCARARSTENLTLPLAR
nr:hypothetical protein GCM10017611_52070 [Rhodococcus wratislaviensis]